VKYQSNRRWKRLARMEQRILEWQNSRGPCEKVLETARNVATSKWVLALMEMIS
jgi:hypothetical protein